MAENKKVWKNYDIEMTQNYINENNIETRREFQSPPHRGLYKRARLNRWLSLLKFPKELNDWSKFKSIKDVQEFIDSENIPNPAFMYNNYRGLHNKCCEKGWIKFLKFPEKLNDWSNVINIESANKFIADNNISSPKEFKEKFPGLVNLCTRRGWVSKLEYPNYERKSKISWEEFINTIEDVQKFINDNRISRTDLHDKYPGLYSRCYFNDWNINSLKFFDKPRKEKSNISKPIKPRKEKSNISRPINNPFPEINSLELFQIFIIDNKISSLKELKKRFKDLSKFAIISGWTKNISYFTNKTSWKDFDSPDKVVKFLQEHNIHSHTEFHNKFPGLYSKCYFNKWIDKLDLGKDRKTIDWISKFNNINDINDFLENNNIKTLVELRDTFPGLLNFCRNNGFFEELNITKTGKTSSWETKLKNFLEIEGIKIDTQTTSYSSYSKIDISIIGTNINIEIQGPTHITENCIGGIKSFLRTRKSDLKKHRWCKENGITLLYFSYDPESVKKYGYPWYIYTSEKELLEDIKKLMEEKH